MNGPVQDHEKPVLLFRVASFCPLQLHIDIKRQLPPERQETRLFGSGVRFDPKEGQIGPKDRPETFSNQILVNFDSQDHIAVFPKICLRR